MGKSSSNCTATRDHRSFCWERVCLSWSMLRQRYPHERLGWLTLVAPKNNLFSSGISILQPPLVKNNTKRQANNQLAALYSRPDSAEVNFRMECKIALSPPPLLFPPTHAGMPLLRHNRSLDLCNSQYFPITCKPIVVLISHLPITSVPIGSFFRLCFVYIPPPTPDYGIRR